METVITNRIIIDEPTPFIVNWCKDNLIFNNPEYQQMVRMGKENVIKWKKIPEKLELFSKVWGRIEIPFGCVYALWDEIKKYPYELNFNCAGEISIKNDNPTYELFDYQEEAISEMLKFKGGVLVSPCGSGKTLIGIEIIRRIGKKALWLCHTSDLLTQTKSAMLNQYPNIKIGLTTNGKFELGEDVTISTVQTLVNIDPDMYKDKFDVIIVDEASHVSGSVTQIKMFSKIISKIPARYKFGLTATPSRADKLINSMYAYIGLDKNGEFKPMSKVDSSKVKTIRSFHEKFDINSGYDDYDLYKICDASGMINYNKLVAELSENEERTLKIIDNIEKCYKEGRKQVVLTLRKQHCEDITRLLNDRGIETKYIASNLSAKKREEIIKQEVKWDVIVATYSLLKEGVNIKELDTLHLATPASDKSLIVQCAGRIERYIENKKQPIVYDYVDIDIPYCERKYNQRRGYLRRRF